MLLPPLQQQCGMRAMGCARLAALPACLTQAWVVACCLSLAQVGSRDGSRQGATHLQAPHPAHHQPSHRQQQPEQLHSSPLAPQQQVGELGQVAQHGRRLGARAGHARHGRHQSCCPGAAAGCQAPGYRLHKAKGVRGLVGSVRFAWACTGVLTRTASPGWMSSRRPTRARSGAHLSRLQLTEYTGDGGCNGHQHHRGEGAARVGKGHRSGGPAQGTRPRLAGGVTAFGSR